MEERMTEDTTPAGAGKGADDPAPTPGKVNGKIGTGKRKRAGVVLLLVMVVAALFVVRWWVRSHTNITTDNAFVEAKVYSISSRIPGSVKEVAVTDNQLVRAGALLVSIDPADYAIRMQGAEAALATAGNETSADYAKMAVAQAKVSSAKASLEQAELDLRRGKALFAKEVIPLEHLDRLETARKMAQAKLGEAQEEVRKEAAAVSGRRIGGKEAKIALREAQLREARLNLDYTRIMAPAAGYITRKGVEPGNNIQAGQPLMALVALDAPWVTANYKERQLTHVRPGQQVEFTVDTYPGRIFRGKVESIMAGTGAAFSLLPPENATGNYVKVVQRIPVKILVDPASDRDHLLRVGMSVVPTILTGRTLGNILRELIPFE